MGGYWYCHCLVPGLQWCQANTQKGPRCLDHGSASPPHQGPAPTQPSPPRPWPLLAPLCPLPLVQLGGRGQVGTGPRSTGRASGGRGRVGAGPQDAVGEKPQSGSRGPQKFNEALLLPSLGSQLVIPHHISLILCMSYKLLGRILLAKITPLVEAMLPNEQSGFQPAHSCTDQVFALTTHTEAEFLQKNNTGAAFFDLSAACEEWPSPESQQNYSHAMK